MELEMFAENVFAWSRFNTSCKGLLSIAVYDLSKNCDIARNRKMYRKYFLYRPSPAPSRPTSSLLASPKARA
jgi:hypothetical protein